ncbi:MAG: adenosine deaminase [Candidatus Cloacimonas sp. SDB]|nr:MAG: adenosine deaminase [Candidatus Cloacimonas sp. SDB]
MKFPVELIKKIPKTDLHVHLDGSLRIDTIIELAAELGIKLPANNSADLKKIICCDEKCNSLDDYLKAFDITLEVMQDRDAISRIAYELAADAAEENVRYMEVRYSPILHTKKGLSLPEINDAVLEGLKKAEQEFNIFTAVIICGLKHLDPKTTLKMAELAVSYRNKGVVAFDLAGAEQGFSALDHKAAVDLCHKNYLNLTIHAGEAGGAENIKQAIYPLGAQRIGHGTHLYEDKDLLNFINDHRIALEVCLTSNVDTQAVKNLAEHPFKKYLDYGIQVTLNTDNRLISDTTLTREYCKAVEAYDLDFSDVKKIVLNGFNNSFLSYGQKGEIITEIKKEMNISNN